MTTKEMQADYNFWLQTRDDPFVLMLSARIEALTALRASYLGVRRLGMVVSIAHEVTHQLVREDYNRAIEREEAVIQERDQLREELAAVPQEPRS